jgi:hypothetical protein
VDKYTKKNREKGMKKRCVDKWPEKKSKNNNKKTWLLDQSTVITASNP